MPGAATRSQVFLPARDIPAVVTNWVAAEEARDPAVPDPITHITENPADLTLANFFTQGWNEEFTRRPLKDRAPDLALLRVQTNFMEREFRVNYFFQDNIHTKKRTDLSSMDYFVAYSFNRRLMVEVLGNYQWVDGRGKNPDFSGQASQLVTRVQLISLRDSSYSFNSRIITPNNGFGEKQTTISYGLAGFEDLTRFGLDRVGLYSSVLFDSLLGPAAAGSKHSDVQYDISIAKTFTDPKAPLLGAFTLFLENFAQTDLDGSNSGHTLFTITPGVRFNFGKLFENRIGIDNWIIFGTDIPLAGPTPWAATYRFSYIKNF